MADELPVNCYKCKYKVDREQLSYMPYKECRRTGKMIYYNHENGYSGRMKWCPLEKEKTETNT